MSTDTDASGLPTCPDCGRLFLEESTLKLHRGNPHTDCTPAETIY